ncbi:MAG TPA: serine acetyltransferase, partial [Sphingomonas bacterium]|nr:serine acetyltransferase [Sphingomonas bacterium]
LHQRGDACAIGESVKIGVAALVEAVSHALYPVRLGGWRGDPAAENGFVAERLGDALTIVEEQAGVELAYWQDEAADDFDSGLPAQIATLFAEELPDIRRLLDADLAAALIGDPAARSIDEVLICYPGAAAILHHRIANALYRLGAPIVARVVSELANARTGIDIHPGATIGGSFFIDHGTGVVIGETAIVGERVRLYQHVTLGARAPLGLSADGPRQRLARHPIVEDDVTIYAGTTILGRVTIGRGSVIGGNVWLLDDVAPGSVVAQPTASVLPLGEADDLNDRLHGR